MRMLGFTSIFLAAGLAFATPGAAQEPAAVPAAPVAAPAATDNTTAPVAETVADPTLDAAGLPKTAPQAGIGMPHDKGMGLQQQVTPNGRTAHWFHDSILMPLIVGISIFVLALMIWVVIFYRRKANPVPTKTSHNVAIEIAWTIIPVLILVVVAIPSIRLLAAQFKPAPKEAVTLKAIGNQWFWSYEYPDHGGIQLTANMLKEKDEVPAGARYRTEADGPRLLATDVRVVLPVGVPIRLLTTAQDVIHAWAIPAFWIKLDAVPGRVNETSFTIEKPGVYYGQCSELCGARHGYMPITVEAVSPEVFAQWVASKGGKMPAPEAATTTAAAPAGNEADDTTNGTDGANVATVNATAAPAATNAPATGN
ncbi:MAG: cytochrome c oxidase subunit II [Sphingomonadales bacterium]|nr:MAG: cytochrome c oxidase subunit II [Sphingomonadales bacterium]